MFPRFTILGMGSKPTVDTYLNAEEQEPLGTSGKPIALPSEKTYWLFTESSGWPRG